jgi:tetratricopeptide (TPR) repeat protein
MADNNSAPPPGLEEFLAQDPVVEPAAPQQSSAPQPQDPNMPEGLNEFIAPELNEEKYGGLSGELKAGALGVSEGVLGPVGPMIAKGLGAKSEDLRGYKETNPISHGTGQVLGLASSMATGVGEGALLAKLGARSKEIAGIGGKLSGISKLGATERAAQIAKGTSLASKIEASVVQAAVENIALTAGDEITKRIIEDPEQTLGSAMADVGLSGLLGGGAGVALGSISPLWKATAGTKLGKFTEDFKSRMHERMHNPEPLEAMTKELGDFHQNITSAADEVYGPTGLKASATSKSVPELNDRIRGQAQEILGKLDTTLSEMNGDSLAYPSRLTNKLAKNYQEFANVVKNPEATSSEIFNALEDLKRNTQAYSKFDKFIKPTDEAYDFTQKAKELAHDLRLKSEDESVWKGAAKVQQEINSGFKQYIQPLKDFERRFTEKVNGETVISPGKVAAFFNKAGKPSGETQRKILQNFKEATEEYSKAIAKAHEKLGSESPIKPLSLNGVEKALGETNPGSKLADAVVDKLFTDAGSKVTAAGAGALAGGMLGHPYIGALVGEHTLSSFFKSALPALIKPLLTQETNAVGLKAAAEYVNTVSKGEAKLAKAARNIFNVASSLGHATKTVVAGRYASTDSERKRLDRQIQSLQEDPSHLIKAGGAIPHYLPNHAVTIGETTARAVQYLNSIRLDQPRVNPLDSKLPISKEKEAEYQNALDIAAKPLVVLEKIQKGNLTPKDVVALKTMYPGLYQRMSAKIMDEMTSAIVAGKVIPYSKRMSLSMFLGQPLDSTLTPEAIMAAQGTQTAVKQNEAAQQGDKAPAASSVKGLSKAPQRYMTPGQAAEQRRSNH